MKVAIDELGMYFLEPLKNTSYVLDLEDQSS
jgi:hypothetical protein